MYVKPVPSHTPFFPTDEPPDSTTGVFMLGFFPTCSAIIVANGNTVDEPAIDTLSLALASTANSDRETKAISFFIFTSFYENVFDIIMYYLEGFLKFTLLLNFFF